MQSTGERVYEIIAYGMNVGVQINRITSFKSSSTNIVFFSPTWSQSYPPTQPNLTNFHPQFNLSFHNHMNLKFQYINTHP